MKKIAIITLGHLKHRVDLNRIVEWRSSIFLVTNGGEVACMPDGTNGWQAYQDSDLDAVGPVVGADITVAITEYALEDNFYMRRMKDSVVVLSLYETADICEDYDVPIEHFIIKNLYECCMLYHLYDGIPAAGEMIPDIIHDETRSCLFDMNGNKGDVVYSAASPTVCEQCKAQLSKSRLPEGTLQILPKELRRIRRPMYFRALGFVKRHPIFSIIITFVAGMGVELLGNTVYDLLKNLFGLSND